MKQLLIVLILMFATSFTYAANRSMNRRVEMEIQPLTQSNT